MKNLGRAQLVPIPCSDRAEDAILNVLIRNLKPASVGFTPAPVVVLFQCALYLAELPNKTHVLMSNAVKAIRTLAQKLQSADRGMLAYWLGSTSMFLHLLRREKSKVDPEGLFEPSLTESALHLYQHILRSVKQELLAMLVPALLQSQSNLGLSEAPKKSIGASIAGLINRQSSVKDITKLLSDLLVCLQRNYVAPTIVNQMFSELFYFVDAHIFNKILLRKELCSWERAMQIKFNLTQLEQWIINNGLKEALADKFCHVKQAIALLLLNNTVINNDVTVIYDVCPNLNAHQLKQILSIYTPSEYESPVDQAVVQTITTPLDNRYLHTKKNSKKF